MSDATGGSLSRPSLLVVDDERSNLAVLTITLRNEGYEVAACSNGADALAKAFASPPDLILLDIVMPGMDGFQVLEELRSHPETSRVPVIFLSGMEDLSSKLRGFSLGAVDYVTKPFHMEELRARVRIHLQLARSRRAVVEEQSRRLASLAEAQRQLLRKPEEIPNARFSIHYASREEVGGDLYDVVETSSAIHGYFVADASGHDVGTSLVATGARALLRQNASPMWSPEQTFSLVNDALVDWIPPGKYLTAAYACLNRLTGSLSLVGAAHPPCLILPRTGDPWLVELAGDVLGAFGGARFGTKTIRLSVGDRVVLYTDGLIEDPDGGVLWNAGTGRLLEWAFQHRDIAVANLPGRLAEDLVGERRSDDVVVLAFEY